MYKLTSPDVIIKYGSIKDDKFCENKLLYIFAASTPPCRAIEVYTDNKGKVVYVSWQNL